MTRAETGTGWTRRAALTGLTSAAAAAALPAGATEAGVDHAEWTAFLARYRVMGADGVARLRYGAVSAGDHAALKSYVAGLAATRVSALPRADQFALWVNLYNALTVDVVLDAWPVASIREIRNGLFSIGPWKAERIMVEGRAMSLDDIEHATLRANWAEPRIHYVVNCASWSCPDLPDAAMTAASAEAMMAAAARAYVNHPRGARVTADGIVVSSIYRWYREDFGGDWAGVAAHLKDHAEGDLAAALAAGARITGHDYDWAINAA